LQHHWKREKVAVDRLRVADLVDLAEDGSFAALTAPELDALIRVWPDHRVIRTRDRESYLAERVAASVGGVPDSLSDLRARALGCAWPRSRRTTKILSHASSDQ
jgi:hypothetical protein